VSQTEYSLAGGKNFLDCNKAHAQKVAFWTRLCAMKTAWSAGKFCLDHFVAIAIGKESQLLRRGTKYCDDRYA
jgi:hypothetical protein